MNRNPVLFAFFALSATAVAGDNPLDAVYSHIDAAAKTFTGMSAQIRQTDYVSLVNEGTTKAGTVRMLRPKNRSIKMLIEYSGTNNDKLFYDGNEARVYHRKTNMLDIIDAAKYRTVADQYLLLGFGGTSTELKATYDVSYVGREDIAGVSTAHLRLIPKSADTRKNLKAAELWFGDSGLIAQQKLILPGDDYKLVTYSAMIVKAPPEGDMKLEPKGATKHKVEQ